MFNKDLPTTPKEGFFLFLLQLLFVLLPLALHAQQRMVSGVVTDEDKAPLIGATVAVQGREGGTSTDLEGRYTISEVGVQSQGGLSSGEMRVCMCVCVRVYVCGWVCVGVCV